MTSNQIETCTKCGEECVLGVNAITEHGKTVCDSCSNVRRGFAGLLMPEERAELRRNLQEDLKLATGYTKQLMSKALEDATS